MKQETGRSQTLVFPASGHVKGKKEKKKKSVIFLSKFSYKFHKEVTGVVWKKSQMVADVTHPKNCVARSKASSMQPNYAETS